jgi:hypothetical protein
MRETILILFLVLNLNLIYSQIEISPNYKIENNEILWQKVIDIKEGKKEYFSKLKLKEYFNKLEWHETSIAGKTNKKDLKIKSPYWASFPFESFVKIEFKENRCRVTFSNITFNGPEIQVSSVKHKYDYKLSKESLKKGKIKNSKKTGKVLKMLNNFFEKITTDKVEKNSDW